MDFLPTITEVRPIPTLGQSLSTGTNGLSIYNSTPRAVDVAKMFNAGTRVFGDDHNIGDLNHVIPDANIASLVDLHEILYLGAEPGETHCSEMAYRYLGSLPSNIGVMASTYGIEGATIAQLTVDSQPFYNLLYGMRRAKFLLWNDGLVMRSPYVVWIHGEANALDTAADYMSYLNNIHTILDHCIRAITGQPDPVKLVMTQSSTMPGSAIPPALLQAAVSDPTKICVTPMYFMPYRDELHLQAESYGWLGRYIGRAIARYEASGVRTGLRVASAVVSGTTLTATLTGGDSAPVIDTASVADYADGNKGLSIGNAPGISLVANSVSLSGSTITATLSAAPPPGATLEIGTQGTPDSNGLQQGGPGGPGPRTCFRDQSTETVSVGGSSPTLPLYDWLHHDSMPISPG
jgi:hypothetical protein